MTKDDYALFGLKPGATARELKKAYRALAKLNHPDRFTDPAKKKEQERKMVRINDAYHAVLSGGTETVEKTETKTDTSLYKKGAEILNRLNISIAVKFGTKEYEIKTIDTKIGLAREAEEIFKRLLEKYPDSDWSYDVAERLEPVEKYIRLLKENREFLETHRIGTTKKGTPTWKKRE